MDLNRNFAEQTQHWPLSINRRDNVMSPATMTNDVETFDFSEEIRAFQARVETVLTSLNSDFDATNFAI